MITEDTYLRMRQLEATEGTVTRLVEYLRKTSDWDPSIRIGYVWSELEALHSALLNGNVPETQNPGL